MLWNYLIHNTLTKVRAFVGKYFNTKLATNEPISWVWILNWTKEAICSIYLNPNTYISVKLENYVKN